MAIREHLSINSSFNVEIWLELAATISIVFLRCLARIQVTGVRKLMLDDWCMVVAMIFSVFTALFPYLIAATNDIDSHVNPHNVPIVLTPSLGNHDMSDEYRANLDPASVEYQLRVVGSKLHLTGWLLYASTLWCLKLSVAAFYTRLTDGVHHMKIHIRVAYVAIGVTYVVVTGTLLGACRPMPRHWQINPNPGNHCMPAISTLNCYIIVVLNVLTDLYLLHIPTLMIFSAKLPAYKKFFLVCLFSGGIFVMISGILRVYFILGGGGIGGKAAALWGLREEFVAFMISNLPVIYGAIRVRQRQAGNAKSFRRYFGWAARGKGCGNAGEKVSAAMATGMVRLSYVTGGGSGDADNRVGPPVTCIPYRSASHVDGAEHMSIDISRAELEGSEYCHPNHKGR